MAIIKCKMCGGDLEVQVGSTVAECEYCGTQQTVPSADNEKKMSLFARANRLRLSNEFDKAEGVFESIVADFPEEAEAYWGLVLCRYGIEYVDDPATGKKIPTCHRSSYTSILDDKDYDLTLENADPYSRRIYREEAKQIEELRKDIIAVSANEAPYDIFICYKETAPDGQRTLDSVLAQDVYDALTAKGYRVFFARITLEDRLGAEYEPVIFAALHSAKIMLAVGTDYEYFNAVWVKNEWGRYLKLMEKDREKHLIPCYKGIDAYDMPREFAKLQAQDLGKVGAMQDLLRGVEKILPRKAETVKETVVVQPAAVPVSTDSLLKRAFMFLEDGEFARADAFCEQVLNIDPECAMAYVGKLMAELKVKKQENIKNCDHSFDASDNYQKAIRFGNEVLKETLSGYAQEVRAKQYLNACNIMKAAEDLDAYLNARDLFQGIAGYKDSDQLKKKCQVQITKIEEATAAAQEEKEEYQRQKRKIRYITIAASIGLISIFLFVFVTVTFVVPEIRYHKALTMMDEGEYEEAITVFQELNGYKDSELLLTQSSYTYANVLEEQGQIAKAAVTFGKLGSYQDARERSLALWDQAAERQTVSAGDYHTIAVQQYGTLKSTGQSDSDWFGLTAKADTIALSAGLNYNVRLKTDGTVECIGDNVNGQCNTEDWKDIVAISAGSWHTVGLKMDGTVVAVGTNDRGQCDVGEWTDIVAISAGANHTVGLKSDGTVVAVGWNGSEQCKVGDWTDIVAIGAGANHTVGLKSDGTVVATIYYVNSGECDVDDWTNIVAISARSHCTVGLKDDGTVVAVGSNNYGQCEVSGWTDIVAISAGSRHTVGLKVDGTVVAVGDNKESQCNAANWKDIKLPNT